MATIKLDENYKMVSDNHNWTLEFESIRFDEEKQKEVKSKDEWHYPSIQGCLKKYLDQSGKNSNSIDELIEKLNEIYLVIKNLKTQ